MSRETITPQNAPTSARLPVFQAQSTGSPPFQSQENARPPNVPPNRAPWISAASHFPGNRSNPARNGVNPNHISQSWFHGGNAAATKTPPATLSNIAKIRSKE